MTIARSVLAIAALAVCFELAADPVPPMSPCYKPRVPYRSLASDFEMDRFREDAITYERCIKQFIEDQRQAVEYHLRAGKAAAAELEHFTNVEMRRRY